MSRLFIVTVASEKGGVGKTTIATNLAVYLKALREDLPATIASFDNHFSVDQMFAIQSRTHGSVADLLDAGLGRELTELGEYGVQFIRSERRLETPEGPPKKLADRLRQLDLDGILVLDTRPILDWFTEGALLAADLVLVPIKDRASLVNVAAIRALLEARGAEQCLWLVPSLVDARARLNAATRVKDLLVFSARERDYQVVDTYISKSPKVESLASGFSSRVYPVLTHARQTAVYRQFRDLADFVLAQYDDRDPAAAQRISSGVARQGPLRRHLSDCPACRRASLETGGHFFFDLRSRRSGFLHTDCLQSQADCLHEDLTAESEVESLGFRLTGAGILDVEPDAVCISFDANGEAGFSERLDLAMPEICNWMEAMTGLPIEDWRQETILVDLQKRQVEDLLEKTFWSVWRQRRKKLLQALWQREL